MKPFWPLFTASLLASLLASVLDGLNLILLIPLLRTLFGTAGALEMQGPTNLETFIGWLTNPLIGDADPIVVAVRILALFLGVLLLKNLMSYLAAYSRVVIAEGFVRNLRNALFEHILRLDLSYFQTTRQGQLVAAMIADVEEAKGVVSSSLARLFQNAFLIIVSLVALTQISMRLTLLTIATAPILVLGIGTLLRRLKFHARLRVGERGDMTSTVAERVSAINPNIGLVTGATQQELPAIRAVCRLPLLIPGVGAQGGDLKQAVKVGNTNGLAIINTSRSVLYPPKGPGSDKDRIRKEAQILQAKINEAHS